MKSAFFDALPHLHFRNFVHKYATKKGIFLVAWTLWFFFWKESDWPFTSAAYSYKSKNCFKTVIFRHSLSLFSPLPLWNNVPDLNNDHSKAAKNKYSWKMVKFNDVCRPICEILDNNDEQVQWTPRTSRTLLIILCRVLSLSFGEFL